MSFLLEQFMRPAIVRDQLYTTCKQIGPDKISVTGVTFNIYKVLTMLVYTAWSLQSITIHTHQGDRNT